MHVPKGRSCLNMRDQRPLFDLTQDGLVIGKKIQRIYPEFDVSAFVSDVRTEMEGQTLYNVTNAIGRVLRQHLPQDYADALAILMAFVAREVPPEPTRNPTAEVETSLRPISHFVDAFRFSFSLQSESDSDQTILTYYAVAYKRPTGHITRKRYRLSQRKLKPKQRVDYEKSLFPLPSLKQYDNGKACLGWHRFELEINGDILGGFDFEVTAPKNRKIV